MPVDYINTNPWNNPYNPFPVYEYTVVSFLSSNIMFNRTLKMDYFNPFAPDDVYATYTSFSIVTGFPRVRLEYFKDVEDYWSLTITNNSIFNENTFILTTNTKALPRKNTGSTSPWATFGVNGNIPLSSISIQPVVTNLTPWENRRIIGGSG